MPGSPPGRAGARRDLGLLPAGGLGAVGALARVGALAVLAYAAWYQSYDFTGVLLLTACWSVAAVGLALVLGKAGQMALCQASFVLLGAYAYAVPARDLGVPPLAALVLAGLAGAAAAALLSPVLRIRGNYLALATIAVALLIERAFKTGSWLPGGVSGFVGVPDLAIGGATVTSPDAYVAIAVAVLVASVAGAHWAFGRGERRRDVQLIHHDEGLLTAFGGSPLALKRALFVVSGLLGGLSGALLGSAYGYIRPNGFGIAESFALALAVFIGGNGRLLGAVVGMAIYQLSYPVLGTEGTEFRFLLMGVIVIAIVHASPQGLLPTLREVRPLIPRRWPRDRRARGAPAPTAAQAQTAALTQDAARAPAADPPAAALDGGPPPGGPPPAIRLEGVTKRYGGLVAVDDLSVTVPGGALVALVGPNGAGKTTVLDLIAGEQRADAGEVWLGDVPVGALGADRRARLGLARTFQRVRLVRGLNVMDNVMVGADRAAREGRAGGRDEASRRAAALAALDAVGLSSRAIAEVQSLTFADRRLVEMARLLAARPRVALLDEPSSGLNDDEAEGFAGLVRRLRETGCTVVLVEHNLPFVRSLADHVIALDSGRLLASGPPEEVFEIPDFVEAYVGAT